MNSKRYLIHQKSCSPKANLISCCLSVISKEKLFLLNDCSLHEQHEDWDSICLKRNKIEGIWVYSKKIVVKGSVVCNYGGYVISNEDAEKAMNQYCISKFLLEVKSGWKTIYLNHTDKSFSFGKYLNHSQLYPNLKHEIVISASGNVDVLFYKKILKLALIWHSTMAWHIGICLLVFWIARNVLQSMTYFVFDWEVVIPISCMVLILILISLSGHET